MSLIWGEFPLGGLSMNRCHCGLYIASPGTESETDTQGLHPEDATTTLSEHHRTAISATEGPARDQNRASEPPACLRVGQPALVHQEG